MLVAETYLEAIATHLDLDIDDVRAINLFKEGDETHYFQKVRTDLPSSLRSPSRPLPLALFPTDSCSTQVLDFHVPRLVADCKRDSEYEARKQAVAAFNKEHRYRKRGIALIPTTFGLAFGVKSMNQGSALVHVYMDGSVLVAHGGTEMGQSLNGKCLQIAAQELKVPLEAVFTSETSSNTVPNMPPTAASAGSDLVRRSSSPPQLAQSLHPCALLPNAAPHRPAERLRRAQRLPRAQLAHRSPPREARARRAHDGSRRRGVRRAHQPQCDGPLRDAEPRLRLERAGEDRRLVQLCVATFLSSLSLPFGPPPPPHSRRSPAAVEHRGLLYHTSRTLTRISPPDFTQGAAAAEVELDLLTGDHTVLRVDIKMDVGRSINPAIDYGQVEGAFVQGQGWATMEESLHLRNGALFTTGPGAYKVCSLSSSLSLSASSATTS